MNPGTNTWKVCILLMSKETSRVGSTHVHLVIGKKTKTLVCSITKNEMVK